MPPKKFQQEKDSSTELSDSSSDEEVIVEQIKQKKPKKPTKINKKNIIESVNEKDKNIQEYKIKETTPKKLFDVTIDNFSEKMINTLIEVKDENKMKLYYNKMLHQNEDIKINFDAILWQKDIPESKSLKYMGNVDIHLSSNKTLIEQLTKLIELKKAITKFEKHEDKGYYKVLRFYDDITSCLTITQGSPINVFRRNLLHRIAEPEKSNLLSSFNNLENLKCDVLGYHIGNFINYRIEDRKETNRIRDIYMNENEVKMRGEKITTSNEKKSMDEKGTTNKKVLTVDVNLYRTKLSEIILNLDQEKLKKNGKKNFYIYRIRSKIDKPKNFYIFGSLKKYMIRDIDILINNKYLAFKGERFEYEELDNVEVYFECEGQLKVDEYIKKENALINGCNMYYNILIEDDKITEDRIKNKLFLLVNDEIMLNSIIDDKKILNNNCGYIGYIEIPDNYKYIFYDNSLSLQKHLHKLYNSIDVTTQIMKTLSTTSFYDLKISILEDNIAYDDLEITYNILINKMNKSLLLNGFYKSEKLKNDRQIFAIQKSIYNKKYYK